MKKNTNNDTNDNNNNIESENLFIGVHSYNVVWYLFLRRVGESILIIK